MGSIMRSKILVVVSLFLLAGCGDAPRWVKPGVSKSDEEKAERACEAQADRNTPDDAAGVARMQDLRAICMESQGFTPN